MISKADLIKYKLLKNQVFTTLKAFNDFKAELVTRCDHPAEFIVKHKKDYGKEWVVDILHCSLCQYETFSTKWSK